MRHVIERIEFLVVGRDFQPTAPVARAVEEQTSGVRDLTAVNDDLVTVETFALGGPRCRPRKSVQRRAPGCSGRGSGRGAEHLAFTRHTRNDWISLELAGSRERSALNARVKATAGNIVQTDEVRSGGSYLSQCDLRPHFGLGHYHRIDKVETPGRQGGGLVLTRLEVDRFYCAKESVGVVPCLPSRPKATPPALKPRRTGF